MLILKSRFEDFVDDIKRLPPDIPLRKQDLLNDRFLLQTEREIDIYYAPFDYVNQQAKIAIIGITPGWQQMEIAYRTARTALANGLTGAEVCRLASITASFAGGMRTNLVSMLDGLNIPELLGTGTTHELFGTHSALLHPSSAIRYPAFVRKENYSGHNPNILRTAVFKEYIGTTLVEELRIARNALIIPLGSSVSAVIESLAEIDALDRRRCLLGFPHPSGANGNRTAQYKVRKKHLRQKARAWFETF